MLRLGIQYTFSIRDTERHSRQTNYMDYYKMIFRDGRLYLEAGQYRAASIVAFKTSHL